jgi:uncharacterized damage-inducible protein DinB
MPAPPGLSTREKYHALMTSAELLVLNLKEVRRRSRKAWSGIPADRAHWKPDPDAMSCIEIVRHVLEGEFLYTSMIRIGRSAASDETPFTGRPYASVDAEVAFAEPFRMDCLALVASLTSEELRVKTVDRSDKGYVRTLGDFILRMAYHEAVHTGQLLGYLRTMNVSRPNIWD